MRIKTMKNVYLFNLVEYVFHAETGLVIFDRKTEKSKYSECYVMEFSAFKDGAFYDGELVISDVGCISGHFVNAYTREKTNFSYGYEGFKILVG